MKFYDVRNQTNISADLYIYGDIVDDSWKGWTWGETEDVYPSDIRDMLKDLAGKNLNIYINSGGGHVNAGLAISHLIARHDGHTKGIVDGIAASIASVILMGCDEIEMPEDSFVMIHKPMIGASGNSDDFKKIIDYLDVLQEGMLNSYKKHLKEGVDIQTINDLMKAETWLNGNEIEAYFQVTKTKPLGAVACNSNMLEKYKNVPKILPKNMADKKMESKEPNNNLLKCEIDIALAIC